jgi:hypothetical protein
MTNNSINVDFAQTEVQEIRLGESGAVEIILNSGTVVGFTDIGQTDINQGAEASDGYIFFSDGKALEIQALVDGLQNSE